MAVTEIIIGITASILNTVKGDYMQKGEMGSCGKVNSILCHKMIDKRKKRNCIKKKIIIKTATELLRKCRHENDKNNFFFFFFSCC